jgi:hypothetical protein
MAHIEYPGLPTDYVMEMVHRFYDEYYFRPKGGFPVIWKAVVDRDVPRLYIEAKAFLKLRAAQQDSEGSAQWTPSIRHTLAPAPRYPAKTDFYPTLAQKNAAGSRNTIFRTGLRCLITLSPRHY